MASAPLAVSAAPDGCAGPASSPGPASAVLPRLVLAAPNPDDSGTAAVRLPLERWAALGLERWGAPVLVRFKGGAAAEAITAAEPGGSGGSGDGGLAVLGIASPPWWVLLTAIPTPPACQRAAACHSVPAVALHS